MSKQPLPEVKSPVVSNTIPDRTIIQTDSAPSRNETPILSSLLSNASTSTHSSSEYRPHIVPQFDGMTIQTDSDTDENMSSAESENKEFGTKEKPKKRPKINVEKVFQDMEDVFIKRGRARPDHNDQAHHWKSKWARGVYPSDLYIAIGGCSINNIGTIHSDAPQKFKNALFPQGYEATKWFWSATKPGNMSKYILNISVLHVPPPPENYVNNTVRHFDDEILVDRQVQKEEIRVEEVSQPVKEFVFDDFENITVEFEEIAPPSKFFLTAGRKRSSETVPYESDITKKRRTVEKDYENIDEVGEPKPVLLTDDEDTEDLNVRRSVRVWSNKIKKELVEESIPDEIDGWKIPTDDEELEGEIEDQFDTSFVLGESKRVKSRKVGKFREAAQLESGHSSGKSSRKSSAEGTGPLDEEDLGNRRGRRRTKAEIKTRSGRKHRTRKRRIIDTDSEDDEELYRKEPFDNFIEQLAPNFEEKALDSDERPNNVEIISIEEMNNRLLSDDEDPPESSQLYPEVKNEQLINYKKHEPNLITSIPPTSDCALGDLKLVNRIQVVSPSQGSSDSLTEIDNSPVSSGTTKEEAATFDPNDELDLINSGVEPEEQNIESDGSDSVSNELRPFEDQYYVSGSANDSKESVSTELKLLKSKLCRGSPMIVLERLAGDVYDANKSYEERVVEGVARFSGLRVESLTKAEVNESYAELPQKSQQTVLGSTSDLEVDTDRVEILIEPISVQAGETIATSGGNESDGPPEDDDSEEISIKEKINNEEQSQEKANLSKNNCNEVNEEIVDEDRNDAITEDDEALDNSRSSKSSTRSCDSSLSQRRSPRTTRAVNNSSPNIQVRRSARERKQFRCPVKDCEKNASSKLEDILRHVNVNHPNHYASLITKKHDAMYKICSQDC